MKTFLMRKEDVQRTWHHIDATDAVLGRLAVKAAMLLMGKLRPTYTPGVDCGDFVVITNAKLIRLTGAKAEKKVYRRHTGYIGHLREETYESLHARKPERVIQLAVKRMLPKNILGARMLRRLKVCADANHPHQAQAPKTVQLTSSERPKQSVTR